MRCVCMYESLKFIIRTLLFSCDWRKDGFGGKLREERKNKEGMTILYLSTLTPMTDLSLSEVALTLSSVNHPISIELH